MSSGTLKRITSALVLGAIFLACVFAGINFTNGLIFIFGSLVIDEIFCNIFKRKRFSFFYILSQLFFTAPFLYLSYINATPLFYQQAINIALIQNVILIFYLFYVKMEFNIVEKIGNLFPWIAGLFLLFPILSFSSLLLFEEWRSLLLVFIFIVVGMDTGAWFFGKTFGRTKLWEKVSPNKTIEGLVGGSMAAGLAGGAGWYAFFGFISFQLFGLFCLLGILSQIGDLIQSKIKRQVKIKNSSNIIPGHGGVYDRIDGLLFLAPFFLTVLKYHHLKS